MECLFGEEEQGQQLEQSMREKSEINAEYHLGREFREYRALQATVKFLVFTLNKMGNI